MPRKRPQAEPENIEAHYTVGVLNMERGDRPKAIAAFTDVLRLNPRAVATRLHMSRLQSVRKETPISRVSMAQDAARQLPNEPSVQLALARGLISQETIRAGRAHHCAA